MSHGFGVFGERTNWEQRKIKEFMEKEDQKQNWKELWSAIIKKKKAITKRKKG